MWTQLLVIASPRRSQFSRTHVPELLHRVYAFFAAARPPLRPAAFFYAVVPPCDESPPEPDFFPPRLDAPGELAIFAARSFDIPLSFSASYCFSFFTDGLLSGITPPSLLGTRP